MCIIFQSKFQLLAFVLAIVVLDVSGVPLKKGSEEIQIQQLFAPLELPIVYRQNANGVIGSIGAGIETYILSH